MPAAVDLGAGSEFANDFVIEGPLSRGGMGAVYIATQKSTGRKRALKLMHPVLAADEKARERFVREARVGAMIHSDHVVEVIAAGVEAQTPWLAMELLEGEDLSARAQLGPMSPGELGVVLKQVCHALAAAHAVGVVHRDLKPENIFLCRSRSASGDLSVKVLDFGIAKMAAESGVASTGFIGTPLYMAPEQSQGGAITPAADVWSLGLMAFTLLTGRSYWHAASSPSASPMQVLTEVATETIEPASARATTFGCADRLPPGFDAWFARAVARAPQDRFATAADAWLALAPIVGQSQDLGLAFADTLHAGRAKAPPRRRALLALVPLAAVATGGAWWFAQRAPAPVAPLLPDLNDPSLVYKVPLDGSPARGAEHPLVTLVEFGDLECPFTRIIDTRVRAELAKHPNDLRVVYKDYPLNMHPHAIAASWLAQEARAEQGDEGFWKAHDAVLDGQPALEDDDLLAVAARLGLDAEKAKGALARKSALSDRSRADVTLAAALRTDHTPTFFINGRRVEGGDDLEGIIDAALASAQKRFGASREGVYEQLTNGGVSAFPARVAKVPEPPKDARPLTRGTAGPGVVDVTYFGTYSDASCILAWPALNEVLLSFGARVHVVFWDIPDLNNDKEAAAASMAVHAISELPAAWRLHDELMQRQRQPVWDGTRQTLSPELLRQLAVAAGADGPAYDYELRVRAPGAVHRLVAAAQAEGITEPGVYIDGQVLEAGVPRMLMEQAIEQALAKRAQPR